MNTFARLIKHGTRLSLRSLQGPTLFGVTGETSSARVGATASTSRGFAAGGHGHGDSVTYAGLTMHKPARWHVVLSESFCGLMWFWIFYRFYHDYETFLFGHAYHFEHEGPDDEDGEGHTHGGHGHH
eukprot:jgi/Botrbrau1/4769/Bobra.0137s0041.1